MRGFTVIAADGVALPLRQRRHQGFTVGEIDEQKFVTGCKVRGNRYRSPVLGLPEGSVLGFLT